MDENAPLFDESPALGDAETVSGHGEFSYRLNQSRSKGKVLT
jgi:hypothetical protein